MTESVEETRQLQLDFEKITRMHGQCVIPAAVQDSRTREVILIAYVNAIALRESIATRRAVFWSTSRNKLWRKGDEESGNGFVVDEIRVNCEQNSLVYLVTPCDGGICHTKDANGQNRNCYYRRIDFATGALEFI
ncbi:MAG: hypothetical protein LBB67_05125 [Oscillospiraceae bacterium]|jgi:phosphoribosyl-AMP cyclohydrolase|nr:hypothetical protein [Oscillospiraceae bacterium]